MHHVALGLVYLHLNGIVHGDLKGVSILPTPYICLTKPLLQLNVLIDDAGNAVLCDFGLSRVKADVTSRTANADDSGIIGSRNWMAPELLIGKSLKKSCDIYAFGMTLYEVTVVQVVSRMIINEMNP